MSELITAAEWLYSRLNGIVGVTGGVHDGIAALGSAYPAIVFQSRNPIDRLTLNARRIWSDAEYLVRVIGQTTSLKSLETIADAIDTQLSLQSGSGVVACYRVEPFSLIEVIDDVQYSHLGGFYKLLVQ